MMIETKAKVNRTAPAGTRDYGRKPADVFYAQARRNQEAKRVRIEEQQRIAAANWKQRGKSEPHRAAFTEHRTAAPSNRPAFFSG